MRQGRATAEPSGATRISPLDALRGVAALLIAAGQHYQHFGGDKKTYPHADYSVAAFLYEHGWLFVDFFFVLSGVVFAYRYLEPIAQRRVSGREFFVLRFSRLYPLHLVTLCACAGVEWWLMVTHKPFAIYDHNDVRHFFLQLFYLHTWFEKGWSYNEPSWSVGAEVVAYGVFFLVASRWARSFEAACAIVIFFGVAVQSSWSLPLPNENVARALVGFFAGALLHRAIQAADERGLGAWLGWGALGALGGLWTLGWFIGVGDFVGFSPLPYTVVFFPLTIVAALRVKPLAWVLSARPLTFLGDISYSVYLVHVPMQMVFLAMTRARAIGIPVRDARFQLEYVAAVLLVGTVTYYGLEKPAQKWLRNRWLGGARKAEALVAPPLLAPLPGAPD